MIIDNSVDSNPAVQLDTNASVKYLTLNNGSLNGTGTYTLSLSKNLTVASGASITGNANLVFGGGDHASATIDGLASLGSLTFAKTTSGADFGLTGELSVSGDLTITGANNINGNLITGGKITVGGDVSTTDPSVYGTAVIYLNGTHGIISGGGALPTLHVAGGTTTVSGDLHADYLTVSGGTLNANNLGISHKLNISGGTFNAPSGTLTFDGGDHGSATISGGTINLGGLTFAKAITSPGADFTLTGTLPITGDLTITGANLISAGVGGGQITVGGNVSSTDLTVAGTAVIYLANTSHTISGGALPSVEVASGTTTVTSSDLQVYSLTVSGGTFVAPTGTLSIAKNFTRTAGTFNANGGTVSFNKGDHSSVSITGAGATTFNNVSVDKTSSGADLGISGSPLDVNGDLTINGVNWITGTVTVAGNVTTSDTSVTGPGTIVLDRNSGAAQNLTATVAGAQVPNLKIAQWEWGQVLVGANEITVNGDLTIANTNTINGGTINVLKNVVTTDAGVGGTATVKLDGNHSINAGNQSGQLPNLLVTGGTTSVPFPVSLGVQSLTVESSGTFKAPSNLRIARDLTVDGSFVHNNGLVTFATPSGTATVDIANPTTNTLYNMKLAMAAWTQTIGDKPSRA